MDTATILSLRTLFMQIILFAIAVIYLAWKVPTKEDLKRVEDKLDKLNDHFIDHLKNHP